MVLTVYFLPVVEGTADIIAEELHKNLGRGNVSPALAKDALKNNVSCCNVTLVVVGTGSLIIAAVVLAKSGVKVVVIGKSVLAPCGFRHSGTVVIKRALCDCGSTYVLVGNLAGTAVYAAEVVGELNGDKVAVVINCDRKKHRRGSSGIVSVAVCAKLHCNVSGNRSLAESEGVFELAGVFIDHHTGKLEYISRKIKVGHKVEDVTAYLLGAVEALCIALELIVGTVGVLLVSGILGVIVLAVQGVAVLSGYGNNDSLGSYVAYGACGSNRGCAVLVGSGKNSVRCANRCSTVYAVKIVIAGIRHSVHVINYVEGVVGRVLHLLECSLKLICVLSSLIGSGIGNNGSTNLGEVDRNNGVLSSIGILGIITEHLNCGLSYELGNLAVLNIEVKLHEGVLVAENRGKGECEICHKVHIVNVLGVDIVLINIVFYVIGKSVNIKVAEVVPEVLALPYSREAHVVLNGLCINGVVLINDHLEHLVAGVAVLILNAVLVASAVVVYDNVLGALVIP